MRIRSKEELIDSLAEMSQIRRRELFTVNKLIASGREHERSIIRRTALVLSYAHWEGFIKNASIAYVEYVAFRAPLLSSLTANFQAIACRTTVSRAAQASKRIGPHLEFVRQFIDCLSEKAKLDSKLAIDTESNLNSEVFENICVTIGVDYSARWSKYGPFIDDLVENRCAIAHGEVITPDDKYAREVVKFVQEAIDWFRTDVENAALQDAYLRT